MNIQSVNYVLTATNTVIVSHTSIYIDRVNGNKLNAFPLLYFVQHNTALLCQYSIIDKKILNTLQ